MVGYSVDEKLTITAVSLDWDDVAAAGDGSAGVMAAAVVGRPLLDFIVSDVTRMHVLTTLRAAQTLRRPRQTLYRCDTPEHRRLMSMRIVPAGQSLRLEHELVRMDPMRRPVHFRYQADAPRVRCSSCNRFLEGTSWLDPYTLDRDFTEPLAVCYGACTACASRAS